MTIPCKRPKVTIDPRDSLGAVDANCHVPGCDWTYPADKKFMALKSDAVGEHRPAGPGVRPTGGDEDDARRGATYLAGRANIVLGAGYTAPQVEAAWRDRPDADPLCAHGSSADLLCRVLEHHLSGEDAAPGNIDVLVEYVEDHRGETNVAAL